MYNIVYQLNIHRPMGTITTRFLVESYDVRNFNKVIGQHMYKLTNLYHGDIRNVKNKCIIH